MRRYLQPTQTEATPLHKACSNIGHLEGETRNYIINKAESERIREGIREGIHPKPEEVFELLANRFGTGGNLMQVLHLGTS